MKNNMSKLIALVICVFGLSLTLSGCGTNTHNTKNNEQKAITSIHKTEKAPTKVENSNAIKKVNTDATQKTKGNKPL